jgi:hypothetical protein
MNLNRKYLFICPVTEPDTYNQILLKSNDLHSSKVIKLEGITRATTGFNSILAEYENDYNVIIFLHQDVYLPENWLSRLDAAIDEISTHGRWGAIGVAGAKPNGKLSCSLWMSALDMLLDCRDDNIEEVCALDEVLIAINTDENVRFDKDLPGFHLFGTSIVQDLADRGLKSYSINNPIIHHDKVKGQLDKSYDKAYFYLRKKYKHKLPIFNTVLPIQKLPIALYKRKIKSYVRPTTTEKYNLIDPKELARKLNFE